MTEQRSTWACPSPEELSAYLDGELADGAAAIAGHIARCPLCARHVAELECINDVLRAHAQGLTTPMDLRQRIERHDPRRGVVVSRRGALGGLALAASTLLGLHFLTRAGAESIEPALLQDFEKIAAADRKLDFESSDPSRTYAWLSPRVAFALPEVPVIADIGLRGARLCQLLNRRLAALHLGSASPGVCLYITPVDGLVLENGHALPSGGARASMSTRGRVAGAFWQHDELAFGLVGVRRPATIERLAARVRAASRPSNS